MAKIFEMPPHLADLIAAGEVVERPSSVVKELVENSIDAGADSLTVEIKNGGMSMIRVTDNGSGIGWDDAETAFLRHATSKLHDERGLEAIGTLGFRGEALAAISAVSRVELITKEREAPEGLRLRLDGGVKVSKDSCGCPDGTTIIVRDLFFNTPARFKYMKNDRAEGSSVTTVVTRLALSHPEISIKYIREGKEELHTPGDGRMESCVYATLGRDFAKSLLRASSQQDSISVSGYVSTPAAARGNRSWQFFFVNGRFIKSKLLQAALEQAYKNSLFTGKFPVCILNIDMNAAAVDVNVHPAKLEVRFSSEREVFDAVYWACRGALENETEPAELEILDSTAKVLEKGQTGETAPRSFKTHSEIGKSGGQSGTYTDTPIKFTSKPRDNYFKTMDADSFRAASGEFKTSVPPVKGGGRQNTLRDDTRGTYQTRIKMPPAEPVIDRDGIEDEPEKDEDRSWRYVGEALTTYIIVERDGRIFFIDKHAAHERILFDKLKAGLPASESQVLLTPLVCSVGAETAERLAAGSQLLSEFGIELENFGGGNIAVRQLPLDIEVDDPTAFLEELDGILATSGRQGLESLRDDVMHTVACKAAIKAGKRSEPETVIGLIDKVMSGEVRYCPHGRPVMMELTKSQLDRGFKRE